MNLRHILLGCAAVVCAGTGLAAEDQRPKEIPGTYIVDFSGGDRPENVVVATLTRAGRFLSMGMEGEYLILNGRKKIRVELPGEPSVIGDIEYTDTGFFIRATVGDRPIAHRYTRLVRVENERAIAGPWRAIMSVSLDASRPVPVVERLNATVRFTTMGEALFYIGGPYLYRREGDEQRGYSEQLICIRREVEKE